MFACAALVAVAWLLWFADSPEPTPRDDSAAQTPAAPAAATGNVAEQLSVQPTPAEPASTSRTAVPVEDPATARLFGRCVDVDGAPVAGCTVTFSGWPGSKEEEWLRDHAALPPRLESPPVTTGEDGRFTFAFVPPPPFQFALECARDGMASVDGRWSSIQPGAAIDVGDVRMERGVVVHGRVVDQRQQPLADVLVTFERARTGADFGAGRGPLSPRQGEQTYTLADGSFRIEPALPIGHYRVSAAQTFAVEPSQIELTTSSLAPITIVVHVAEDVVGIRGIVTDEAGLPVANARIDANGADGRPVSSRGAAADGAFFVPRPEGDGSTVTLAVDAMGFEPARPDTKFAWGDSGVVLRLRRCAALTVRAVDREGRPVTQFQVRAIPREPSAWSNGAADVRKLGPFDGGVTTVDGVRSGPNLLVVEFSNTSGFATVLREFDMAGNTVVEVIAGPPVGRAVRVVDQSGAAVAGAAIRLCDVGSREFANGLAPFAWPMWIGNAQSLRALLVDEARTDSEGRAVLHGEASASYWLDLPGPGHVAHRVSSVRVDDATEFVVEVRRGGAVHGRLGSSDAVVRAFALAGPDAKPAVAPSVQLVRRGTNDARSVPLSTEGLFDATALDAGDYDVWLRTFVPADGTWRPCDCRIGDVRIEDGATATPQFAIDEAMPVTIDAVVLHNGAPLASTEFVLTSRRASATARTDAVAALRVVLAPGEYTAYRRDGAWMASSSRVVIDGGERSGAPRTFVFATGVVDLTVLLPDGTAAAGVRLRLEPNGAMLSPADADGRVHLVASAGPVRLLALPKSKDADASAEAFAQHGFEVDAFDVVQGAAVRREVRLPEAWSR